MTVEDHPEIAPMVPMTEVTSNSFVVQFNIVPEQEVNGPVDKLVWCLREGGEERGKERERREKRGEGEREWEGRREREEGEEGKGRERERVGGKERESLGEREGKEAMEGER